MKNGNHFYYTAGKQAYDLPDGKRSPQLMVTSGAL